MNKYHHRKIFSSFLMKDIQLLFGKILLGISLEVGNIFGAMNGLEGTTATDYQENERE